MTEETPAAPAETEYVAENAVLDPYAHTDDVAPKNYGRIGSMRPTALLYTGGIGATVDLPHVAVMPQGLDAWELAYQRLGKVFQVSEPRLVEAVKAQIGRQVTELRRPPREETGPDGHSTIGVPAAVFPRWLRCTGCDILAPFDGQGGTFTFVNTIKRRPDKARFEHEGCRGRKGTAKPRRSPAVPARYLVACLAGHLDEFPYWAYVHRAQGAGWTCSKMEGIANPRTQLRMLEWRSNLGPEVHIHCVTCDARRSMRELTGTAGADRMPRCRGRHPHLGTFEKCQAETRFMLLGAANQWFPATVSLLVVPESVELTVTDVAARLQGVPAEQRAMVTSEAVVPMFKAFVQQSAGLDLADVPDDVVMAAITMLAEGGVPDTGRTTPYTAVELRLPEWRTLVRPKDFAKHARQSDFRIRDVTPPAALEPVVGTVAAVDRLKKVNAFVGFTRVDSFDRIDDAARLAPISRRRPRWVPATEDHGEGVFIRLREDVVGPWEESVLPTPLWEAHRRAHELNVRRRTSTSAPVNAAERFEPPRFWAVHTLAHLLIRQMAMDSGYGSASLTERIYAWRPDEDREAAAGFLISTTSPDSEGTLGGLVELSDPQRLGDLVTRALHKASRCSSDPVCSHRTPGPDEDFLHGAACHFCVFNSETSCENANRFLDRRLLRTLYAGQGVDGLLDAMVLG